MTILALLLILSANAAIVTVEHNWGEYESPVKVDHIKSADGTYVYDTFHIYPFMRKKLHDKSILGFTLEYSFGRDEARIYIISCPPGHAETTIRVTDIVNGSLPGECSISRRGKWTREHGTQWLD